MRPLYIYLGMAKTQGTSNDQTYGGLEYHFDYFHGRDTPGRNNRNNEDGYNASGKGF